MALAGCGGSDDSSTAASPTTPPAQSPAPTSNVTPAKTAFGVAEGAATSASIGPAGGTIATPDGKARLTIPAGALATTTTISLQPITNNAHGGKGRAYRLSPEGVTFANAVHLSFTYTDADLVGTAADALGVAFQRADGAWEWMKNPLVDTATKVVTVSTNHFSDWSLVAGFQLFPHEATVATGKTVGLKVLWCYRPGENESGLIPLGYACAVDDMDTALAYVGRVDEWSVNGVLGGNGTTGTVVADGYKATFTAPSTKPSPESVAVSARVQNGEKGKTLIVSNITIKEPDADYTGTVEFDNGMAAGTAKVSWKKIGVAEGAPVYMATGTVDVTTHVEGCTNVRVVRPLVSNSDAGLGAYKLITYPESFGAMAKQYYFHVEGEGADVTLSCGGQALTFPVRMLTNVVVGARGACTEAPPSYTDVKQLTGTWSCGVTQHQAKWSFTGQ